MTKDCCTPEQGNERPANCCDERLVTQLKALGHPVRMQIVRQLTGSGSRCCGDFCSCMPQAQSTISQHLDLLCKAGLVEYRPDGNKSRYSLNHGAFSVLAAAIAGYADMHGGAAAAKLKEAANG